MEETRAEGVVLRLGAGGNLDWSGSCGSWTEPHVSGRTCFGCDVSMKLLANLCVILRPTYLLGLIDGLFFFFFFLSSLPFF